MIVFAGSNAEAALSSVGAVDPVNHFPALYGDAGRLPLQLCLDGDGVTGMCTYDPPIPGNAFSEAIGFGAEVFWYDAGSLMDVGPGGLGRAKLVIRVEGTWFGGVPVDGDQMTFGRVELASLSNLQPNKTYTVFHPYGQFDIQSDATGAAPRHREEIGCAGAPCDFSAALGTSLGPYLVAVNPPPPAGYIGNPQIDQTVTGSPVGQNFFRITGPGINPDGSALIESDQFNVMGKIFGGSGAAGMADYNLDRSGEIGVFRSGMWFLSYSLDHAGVDQVTAFGSSTPGVDKPQIGEYDCTGPLGKSDGVKDISVFRTAASTWMTTLSSNGWPSTPAFSVSYGSTSHKRIDTRYMDTNGDGCTDFGIFRDGCFDFIESPGYSTLTARHVCFGVGTDEPLAADLNGDGKSDLILWRAASAHYSYRLSPNYATNLGADIGAGTVPLVGDVNGDGKADLGSYVPATSTFRFNFSPDYVGLDLVKTHGVNGDIPIISEVTGDYIDDIGIFRPSVARWWFKCSPNHLLDCMSHSFGVAGDVPIYGKPAGVP